MGLSPTKFQRLLVPARAYMLRTFPAEHLNYSDGDSAEREINVQSPPPSPSSPCNPMSRKKFCIKVSLRKNLCPSRLEPLPSGLSFLTGSFSSRDNRGSVHPVRLTVTLPRDLIEAMIFASESCECVLRR